MADVYLPSHFTAWVQLLIYAQVGFCRDFSSFDLGSISLGISQPGYGHLIKWPDGVTVLY